LVARISYGNTRLLQVAYSTGDVARGHVVPWVFVVANDENALVVTCCGKDNKVMELLKVSVILRQDRPPVTDGVGQVGLVAHAAQTDISGNLNIVSITAQPSDEGRIDA